MFKLVVLSTILAVAAAGYLNESPLEIRKELRTAVFSEPAHIAVQEPFLTKVGERVETIPTSFSHVYRSDVHSKALVKDIIAPVVKSYAAPITKTYIEPIAYAAPAPIIKTVAHAPIVKTLTHSPIAFGEPLTRAYGEPLTRAYGGIGLTRLGGARLAYNAGW